jgi:hypothetical protein
LGCWSREGEGFAADRPGRGLRAGSSTGVDPQPDPPPEARRLSCAGDSNRELNALQCARF